MQETVRTQSESLEFFGSRICGTTDEGFETSAESVLEHLTRFSVHCDISELISHYHTIERADENSLTGKFLSDEQSIKSTFASKVSEGPMDIYDVDALISNVPHSFSIKLVDNKILKPDVQPTCQSSLFYDIYGIMFTNYMLHAANAKEMVRVNPQSGESEKYLFVDAETCITPSTVVEAKRWAEYIPELGGNDRYVDDIAYARLRGYKHSIDSFDRTFFIVNPDGTISPDRRGIKDGSFFNCICADTLRLDGIDRKADDITYLGQPVKQKESKMLPNGQSITHALECHFPNIERPFAKVVVGYHIDVEKYWACVETYLTLDIWHVESACNIAFQSKIPDVSNILQSSNETLQERLKQSKQQQQQQQPRRIKVGCERRHNFDVMIHFESLFSNGKNRVAYTERGTTSLKKGHPNYYSCLTLNPLSDIVGKTPIPYEILLGFDTFESLDFEKQASHTPSLKETLSRQTSKRLLLNYANVSISCLNGLRKYTDVFRWVYGVMSARCHKKNLGWDSDGSFGDITFYDWNTNYQISLENILERAHAREPVVLVESLFDYVSLSNVLYKNASGKEPMNLELQNSMLSDVFLQVTNALNMAGKFFEFSHGHFTTDNIYVRRLDKHKKIKVYSAPEFDALYDKHVKICWKAFKHWYKYSKYKDPNERFVGHDPYKIAIKRDVFTSLVNRHNPMRCFSSGYVEREVLWEVKIDGFEHSTYKINGFKVPMTSTVSRDKSTTRSVTIPVNLDETCILTNSEDKSFFKIDRSIDLINDIIGKGDGSLDPKTFTLMRIAETCNVSSAFSNQRYNLVKSKQFDIDQNVRPRWDHIFTNFNVMDRMRGEVGYGLLENVIFPNVETEKMSKHVAVSVEAYNISEIWSPYEQTLPISIVSPYIHEGLLLSNVISDTLEQNRDSVRNLWNLIVDSVGVPLVKLSLESTKDAEACARKFLIISPLFECKVGRLLWDIVSADEISTSKPNPLLFQNIRTSYRKKIGVFDRREMLPLWLPTSSPFTTRMLYNTIRFEYEGQLSVSTDMRNWIRERKYYDKSMLLKHRFFELRRKMLQKEGITAKKEMVEATNTYLEAIVSPVGDHLKNIFAVSEDVNIVNEAMELSKEVKTHHEYGLKFIRKQRDAYILNPATHHPTKMSTFYGDNDATNTTNLLSIDRVVRDCLSTGANSFFTDEPAVEKQIYLNPVANANTLTQRLGYFDPAEDFYKLIVDIVDFDHTYASMSSSISDHNNGNTEELLLRIVRPMVGCKYDIDGSAMIRVCEHKSPTLQHSSKATKNNEHIILKCLSKKGATNSKSKRATLNVLKESFSFVVEGRPTRGIRSPKIKALRKMQSTAQSKYDAYKLCLDIRAVAQSIGFETLPKIQNDSATFTKENRIPMATNVQYDTFGSVGISEKKSKSQKERQRRPYTTNAYLSLLTQKAVDETSFEEYLDGARIMDRHLLNLDYQRYFYKRLDDVPDGSMFKYSTIGPHYVKRSLDLPYCARGGKCNLDDVCDAMTTTFRINSKSYASKPLVSKTFTLGGLFDMNDKVVKSDVERLIRKLTTTSGSIRKLLDPANISSKNFHGVKEKFTELSDQYGDISKELDSCTELAISIGFWNVEESENLRTSLADTLSTIGKFEMRMHNSGHLARKSEDVVIKSFYMIHASVLAHTTRYYGSSYKTNRNTSDMYLDTSYIVPYPNKTCYSYVQMLSAFRNFKKCYLHFYNTTPSTYPLPQPRPSIFDTTKGSTQSQLSIFGASKEKIQSLPSLSNSLKTPSRRLSSKQTEITRSRPTKIDDILSLKIPEVKRVPKLFPEAPLEGIPTMTKITSNRSSITEGIICAKIFIDKSVTINYIKPIVMSLRNMAHIEHVQIANTSMEVKPFRVSIDSSKKELLRDLIYRMGENSRNSRIALVERDTKDTESLNSIVFVQSSTKPILKMTTTDTGHYSLEINCNDPDFDANTRNFVHPRYALIETQRFDMFSIWGFLVASFFYQDENTKGKITPTLKDMFESIAYINRLA